MTSLSDLRIPYGAYWSTPFSRWQMSLSDLHSMKLAAVTAAKVAKDKEWPLETLDHAVLGMTVPQEKSFWGTPWLMTMMGAPFVTGPTVSQACATSARALSAAVGEIAAGDATASLVVTCDRTSNSPVVVHPNPRARFGRRPESRRGETLARPKLAQGARIGYAKSTFQYDRKLRMSVREPATKVKKSELRREAILQNALKLFDRQGFANTSLDDIARETGVKREAIYYYFSNRAEILLHIIRPQSESLVEGLRAVVDSRASFQDKLYGAIRNHLERFDRHCLEMTVSLRDVYLEDAREVRREMDKIWRSYETLWTGLIADGQKKGDFEKYGEPKMIAFGILGLCNWLARWYNPKKEIAIEELFKTYFSMVAFGLVKERARRAVRSPDKKAAPRRVARRAPVDITLNAAE